MAPGGGLLQGLRGLMQLGACFRRFGSCFTILCGRPVARDRPRKEEGHGLEVEYRCRGFGLVGCDLACVSRLGMRFVYSPRSFTIPKVPTLSSGIIARVL